MLRPHAGEDPEHVLVVKTLGAPQRRLIGSRRERKISSKPEPEPVATGRITLIDADPFEDADAADAWLKQANGEALMAHALPILNRVVHAHRVAAADPWVRDLGRDQAIVARYGYGQGEQVADGLFIEARELPPLQQDRPSRHTSALRPQERIAWLLAGRDVALACEELILRARSDLDAGRLREAALTLRVALEAALAELAPWAERSDLAARLDELREHRHAVGAAANRALQGGLDDDEAADVRSTIQRLEAALRARSASGIE